MQFKGVYAALVTPFDADGAVDHKALASYTEALVEKGIQGVVPTGTTGESATLSHKEHGEVIRTVVEAVHGRVPVVAGTGSNATTEAIALTQAAQAAGADGSLLISPYYNKPSQEGLYRHFCAIADAVGPFPLVLYNIPGRTAIKMTPETIGRLAELPSIVGVKETVCEVDHITQVRQRTDDDFAILGGEDSFFLPLLALGGHGIISVSANTVPEAMVDIWEAWQTGATQKALDIYGQIHALTECLFIETNPAPIKEALALLNMIPNAELRLPMTRVSRQSRAALQEALALCNAQLGNVS